jgi:serine/threonine protein kinase
LKEFVGNSKSSLVFTGMDMNHETEPLIIKVLHKDTHPEYLLNEVRALTALDRLVAFDDVERVIIQKAIVGVLLQSFLPYLYFKPDILRAVKTEYAKLANLFYRRTNLIHFDISPRNVLVDLDTGMLNLIDFADSRLASLDPNVRFSELQASRTRAIENFDAVVSEGLHLQDPDFAENNESDLIFLNDLEIDEDFLQELLAEHEDFKAHEPQNLQE